MFAAYFRFELKSYYARLGESLLVVAFFILAGILFTLAQPVGSMTPIAALGGFWLSAFLCLSLTQFAMFERDEANGMLEQWPLMPISMEWLFFAKLLSHWMFYGWSLLLSAPVAALLLNIPAQQWPSIMMSLGAASLGLTALGGLASACALRFRNGQLISIMLVLPLCVPLLIFASQSVSSHVLITLALSLLIVPLASFGGAYLIRQTVA